MRALAAVVHEPAAAFRIEDVEIGDPRAGEVLVRIHAVGVCHTDISVQHGLVPVPMPLVLGHEGAGVVEAVGDGVTTLAPGDKVALSFGSCGACASCRADAPAYCEGFMAHNYAGARPDGSSPIDGAHGAFFSQSSFATHAIASERNAVKLADDVDLTIAGPLGCGIQTGAGTVLNRLAPEEGESLAVFGVGAVGLSAVMAAKVAGCDPIVAVDVKRSRLELARELGATHVIDASAGGDVVAEIQEITGSGVDYAVETTANEAVATQAVGSLALRGTCAVLGVGAPGTRVVTDMTELILFGRNVTGVVEGDSDPQRFIPRLLELHAAGRFPFDRLISTYPFEEINRAIEDVESGAATKAVLVMADAG